MDGLRWLLLPKWFITSVIKSSKLMMNSPFHLKLESIAFKFVESVSLEMYVSSHNHVHLKLQFDFGISWKFVWNASHAISIEIFAFNKSKIDEKVVTNLVNLLFWCCGMWRCLEFRLCHIYLENNRTASIDRKLNTCYLVRRTQSAFSFFYRKKEKEKLSWVCVRNIFKDECRKLNRWILLSTKSVQILM